MNILCNKYVSPFCYMYNIYKHYIELQVTSFTAHASFVYFFVWNWQFFSVDLPIPGLVLFLLPIHEYCEELICFFVA